MELNWTYCRSITDHRSTKIVHKVAMRETRAVNVRVTLKDKQTLPAAYSCVSRYHANNKVNTNYRYVTQATTKNITPLLFQPLLRSKQNRNSWTCQKGQITAVYWHFIVNIVNVKLIHGIDALRVLNYRILKCRPHTISEDTDETIYNSACLG